MRLRTITGEPANPYQGGVITSTVKAVALCTVSAYSFER